MFSPTHSDHVLQTPPVCPSKWPRLPHEILLHIFRLTIPPIHQHDPSIMAGPRSPWLAALRTRKALTITCKSFHGPAMEVLYEDIVLRRMGQIPALSRTLGPAPNPGTAFDIATLVKSIRLDSCVVWVPCAEVVREDLDLIFRRCTALRSFSFHPNRQFITISKGLPSPEERSDGFNPAWFLDPDGPVGYSLRARLSTSLQCLDVDVESNEQLLTALHSCLADSPRLEVLKIANPMHANYSDAIFSLPTLHLPALRDLQLYAVHRYVQDYITDKWQLPQLRSLTIVKFKAFPESILRNHGAGMTYLNVGTPYLSRCNTSRLSALEHLSALCPVLEHLVIPAWTISDSLVIHSPTLYVFDVLNGFDGLMGPHGSANPRCALCPTSRLPRLKHIRIISPRWRNHRPDVGWPRICSPDAFGGNDEDAMLVHNFPGVCVMQTSWGVLNDTYEEDVLLGAPGSGFALLHEEVEDDEFEMDASLVSSDATSDVDTGTDTDADSSFSTDEDEDGLRRITPRVVGAQLDRDTVLEMCWESHSRDVILATA